MAGTYKCRECDLSGSIGFLAVTPHNHPQTFGLQDINGKHTLTAPAGVSKDAYLEQWRNGHIASCLCPACRPDSPRNRRSAAN